MKNKKFILLTIFIFTIILSALTGCSSFSRKKETTQKLSSSETVFETILPEPIADSDEVFLEMVDDVTGIGLNPKRIPMQKKDDRSVFARIPLNNGSIIKYRYVLRSDKDTIEQNASGSPVIYRMYFATRPAVVKDVVQNWPDNEVKINRGEISGYVYDEKTDLPISDIIISINGNTTISGADGYYELRNIPSGEFLITAIHPNGIYEPFQQGAVIAENALTPASFGLKAAEMIEIDFELTVPENTINGAPIRMIGNTYGTGNVFNELPGASSVIPSRSPLLTYDGKQTYHLSLTLPAGMDFHYKYTLGNGFINAERSMEGDFLTRQYIVPNRNAKVKNIVTSWSKDKNNIPINFSVSVPVDTPAEDKVSIQFNPFSWMPSIPMWKTSDLQWTYTLYGPFEYLDKSQFRICRNDQCGYADDTLTAGVEAGGFILNLGEIRSTNSVTYQVDHWVGHEKTGYLIQSEAFGYDKPAFIKGLGFDDDYDPYALPYLEWGMIDAAISGVNYLCLSPTWPLQNQNGNTSAVIPGETYSTIEINDIINYAQQAELEIVLFPKPDHKGLSTAYYWAEINTSYDGWGDWFNDYEKMIRNYAYLSQDRNLKFMIIGGQLVAPALPEGQFPDGSPSNTPYDIADQWTDLISEVRSIFSGQIIFALPDSLSSQESYSFLQNVDAVMVLTESAVSENDGQDYEQLTSDVSNFLDQTIYNLYQNYNKPVLLGLSYSALDGSATNCVDLQASCAELLLADQETASIDLDEQASIYNAFYSQSLSRDWIVGIFSMEYEPAVIVRDGGISTRGKPAFDVITYYNNHVIQ